VNISDLNRQAGYHKTIPVELTLHPGDDNSIKISALGSRGMVSFIDYSSTPLICIFVQILKYALKELRLSKMLNSAKHQMPHASHFPLLARPYHFRSKSVVNVTTLKSIGAAGIVYSTRFALECHRDETSIAASRYSGTQKYFNYDP
jgi:hypothetical protein